MTLVGTRNGRQAMHLTGFGGMALAVLLSVSPMKAVLEARRHGSLGGLDTRNWALFFLCNLMWFLYSSETRDFWVYLSAIIGMCTWLWFCMTGIELLSLEEGELFPAISRATTVSTQPGQREWMNDFKDIHHRSVLYRKKALDNLRGTVAASLVFGTTVSFVLSPRSIPGMGFVDDVLDPELRLNMFSFLAAASTFVCWVVPVFRMGSIIKRKDASSVYIPLTLAQMVNTSSWGVYGLLVADWAISIPNFAGSLCGLLFIVLRIIYGGGSAQLLAAAPVAHSQQLARGAGYSSDSTSCTSVCSSNRSFLSKRSVSLRLVRPTSSPGKWSKVVNAAQPALTDLSSSATHPDAEQTSSQTAAAAPTASSPTAANAGPTAGRPPSSRRAPLPAAPAVEACSDSNAGERAAERQRDREAERQRDRETQTQRQTDTGTSNFLEVVSSSCGASAPVPTRVGAALGGVSRGLGPSSITVASNGDMKLDLPDLSQRLRDCGIYEDYLRWQRDYRSWRCGSGRGAQGEVTDSTSRSLGPRLVEEAIEDENV